MGEAQAQRYALWAQRFYAETRGQITFVPQTIHHLWHGSMESRRARQRHRGLSALGFDPYRDLRLSPRGVWQWSSERPELHRYVREYFESRGGAEREGVTS
ncbi:MAG: hypothetical protein CNCCGFBP_00379 [Fimbriimonadaceae bacterium]|nr:hypothetical protein [Fimbriimonadaceae bacterium]